MASKRDRGRDKQPDKFANQYISKISTKAAAFSPNVKNFIKWFVRRYIPHFQQIISSYSLDIAITRIENEMPQFRHDICRKHHKQRLCEIISTRVKFHFADVF